MKRARPSTSKAEVEPEPVSTDDDDGKSKPSAIFEQSAKGIKRKINDTDSSCKTVPWAKTEPSSPRKTTWMIENLQEETNEIKRMIDEAFRVLNKKSSEDEEYQNRHYYESEDEIAAAKELRSREPNYPLRTIRDLYWVEDALKKDPVSYGSRLRNTKLLLLRESGNACKLIRNMLKFLISDELAAQFVFTGAEAPFKNFSSLLLYTDIIQKVVKKKFKTTEDKLIIDEISKWLSHCRAYQHCSVCASRRNR